MAAALLLFAGACTEEVSYDPAPKYDGDEVYFKLEEIGDLDIDTDATSVSFHLYRVDSSKDLTIGLVSSVVNPDGESVTEIFGVPTEVTFPAGQSMIEVPVSIVFSAVTAEMPYTMTVSIAGEQQTPYGATSGEFTLIYGTKYYPWEDYLPGQYATFQMAGAWSYYYEAPIYFHKSINMPHLSQYKIEDPFSDVDWDYLMTVDHSMPLTIDGQEGECYLVRCGTINTTVDFQESILYLLDVYNFIESWLSNPTADRILNIMALNEMQPSFINETTGTLYVNLIAQTQVAMGTSSYYPSMGGVQVVQLPGFKTYGVAIDEAGYNVLPGGLEQKKFQIFKTEDTPVMKYSMYKGTLTDEEIAAKAQDILANDKLEEITANEATIAFELETGDYTLVVVGIEDASEEPEVVATKALSFSYASTSADGFVTTGKCYYTDAFLCSLDGDLFNAATVTVDVQTNPDKPGIYRLKNPYRAWAEATENEDYLMAGNFYITVNAADVNLVYIEEFNTGIRINPFEGPVMGYSKAAQELAKGTSAGAIKLRKLNGTMKNNVITFPTKTLLVNYQSQLPEWVEANTRSNFKIDFNVTEDTEEAPIRGTVVARGNVIRNAADFDRNAVEASIR